MSLVFLLLVIYQLKHWVCDYPLQRPWMLGKFLDGWKWVLPLSAHAAVHGVFTYAICAVLMATGWKFALLMAVFDAVAHFVMDRVKASRRLMGRWKPLTAEQYGAMRSALDGSGLYPVSMAKERLRGNTLFWYALGVDQAFHHLTHYFIIWMLVH